MVCGLALLKVHMQSVLAQARHLYGWTKAAIDLEIYKCADGKELSASEINRLFNDVYLMELTPPVMSSILNSMAGVYRGYCTNLFAYESINMT